MFPEGHVHIEKEDERDPLLSTNLGLSTIRITSKACIAGTLNSVMLLFAAMNVSMASPELLL